jgi:hypothetical protein
MRGSRDSSVSIATLQAGRSGYRIPVGASFSTPVQTGSEAHPASYTMSTGTFPGVKRPVRGDDHPHPSSAEIKERVELYVYSPSGASWPVLGWTLPLLYLFACMLEVLYPQTAVLSEMSGTVNSTVFWNVRPWTDQLSTFYPQFWKRNLNVPITNSIPRASNKLKTESRALHHTTWWITECRCFGRCSP